MVEKFVKALFDCRKRFILGKVSAKMIFALKPDIFDGILIGHIGSKRDTDKRPVFFEQSIIRLSEQGFDIELIETIGKRREIVQHS